MMSHRLELLAAYRNTDFTIYAPDGELVMRCEQESDAIDELVRTFGKTNCAFITAQNPGSVKLGVFENAQRHRELVHEVNRIGYPHFPGRGVGRASSWDPEESVFIVGIPRGEAQELGRAFGQIAIVMKELGCRAELILCI
jgi:uncharacterized protein DUF3293